MPAAPTPTLINGISGVPSVSVNSALYDCVMGEWQGQAQGSYLDQRTFCSGGWRDEIKGILAIDILSRGFLSHGNAISDPLLNFGNSQGVPCVWQVDTGCQLTGIFHIDTGFGIRAGADSNFTISARSRKACASTWNTTT